MVYRRFGIYLVDFDNAPKNSSVQRGYRPAILISNEENNFFSPTVQVLPLTAEEKKNLPVHVRLDGFGLDRPSIVLCEQIQTVPKRAIRHYISHINDPETQALINNGLAIQLNLHKTIQEEKQYA